ncbi:MAG: GIY-YIG nuclease family protein [Xanthomonadales bacterium]|nr:GIY-YIG nuclease family protein [Xanthomonadales bacterium]
MSDLQPFSLRIFVVDGDPDGLRVIERSNWIGKALVFPRALLPKVKSREEFGQTGVYLLIGPREDGEGEMLYIGEGDPVRPRLERHYAEKDFWNRAVFFVAGPGQLNKAHVQYLESHLLRMARETKRMPLDNGNKPSPPSLSEADEADMKVFLDHMVGMLPIIGINALERPKAPRKKQSALRLHAKGVEASGVEDNQGFVVHAGSQAVTETVKSMAEYVRGFYDLRNDLIKNGVLVQKGDIYEFTQDYAFSSPSAASSVILGRSSNGRTEWKNASGKTLKEIQEAEASA